MAAASSARGTASQLPVTPPSRGNSKRPMVTKTRVHRKDRMAETLPFDRAVNIADV